jgi:hypothetical protein
MAVNTFRVIQRQDRQTYEEAQDDHDVESVISEENTITFKRFKGNFQQY